MMTEIQKQLHEEYREQLKLAWSDPGMVDYCTKHADQVVKTEDGYLLEVKRQSIKKNFCFGYGMYLQSTEEEEKFADDEAHQARTNINYFIKENLKYFNSWIDAIKKYGAYRSANGRYYSQEPSCRLQCYTTGRGAWGRTPEDDPNYVKLSETDTQKLLQAFEDGKEAMKKRLATYLKKYGLSKLNVWTYLRD